MTVLAGRITRFIFGVTIIVDKIEFIQNRHLFEHLMISVTETGIQNTYPDSESVNTEVMLVGNCDHVILRK